jgi:hypothetical protein
VRVRILMGGLGGVLGWVLRDGMGWELELELDESIELGDESK